MVRSDVIATSNGQDGVREREYYCFFKAQIEISIIPEQKLGMCRLVTRAGKI
jgi:hypothetical protein